MDQYGGIIDDAKTLIEWRPILPMLKAWSDARDPVTKFRAAIRVAEFIAEVTDAGQRTRAAIHAADRLASAMAGDVALRDAIVGFLR